MLNLPVTPASVILLLTWAPVLSLAAPAPKAAAAPKATPAPKGAPAPAAKTPAQVQQQAKATADGAVAGARKAGLVLLKALPPVDLDGDGRLEVVAACQDEHEDIMLTVWRQESAKEVTLFFQGHNTGAAQLLNLELRNLVGSVQPEILLEAVESSPDETRRQLHVFKVDEKGPREILSLSHPQAGPPASDTVSFGDASPGYRFLEADAQGNQAVALKREPKTVTVQGHGAEPTTLIIGVKELVYSYSAGGVYSLREERQVNFLPSLKLRRVSGSSQKLPAKIMQAEQDRALESAFETAFDAPPDGGPAPELANSVETNPAPRALWATDNNLDTAWVENAKGDGTGEWLELAFSQPKDVRMVRVVPVCALDEKDLLGHNEITAFSLLFGVDKVSVNRMEKTPSDSGVLAVMEVPTPDRKFAPQVLVFLKQGIKTPWVRLVIDKVKKRGKSNDTCVAEISLH